MKATSDIDQQIRAVNLRLNAIARSVTPTAFGPPPSARKDYWERCMGERSELWDKLIELKRRRAEIVNAAE